MNILDIDFASIISLTVSPLELVLRGTLMHWFLFSVFRFALRRDVGALGISDFLFVVTLGDAAQNGMIGSATSAVDGIGLVHVPVALYPASQNVGIDFDWLDKRSMDPVGYKRVNKRTGKEIQGEHIVKGSLGAWAAESQAGVGPPIGPNPKGRDDSRRLPALPARCRGPTPRLVGALPATETRLGAGPAFCRPRC